MKTVLSVLLAITAVVYPVLVYAGLSYFSVKEVAMVLGSLLGLRIIVGVFSKKVFWGPFIALAISIATPMGIAIALDSEFALRLMPSMINVSLFFVFGATLWTLPMIERFASMYNPDLSKNQKKHCRQFTLLWCAFFLGNALVSFALCWAPLSWWALYTGLLSYVMMGVLFASEFLVRRYRFREFSSHFYDTFLKGILPKKQIPEGET